MFAPSILIVDDNVEHLELLHRALKPLGCPISLAPNAVQALQRLHEVTPALILLDIALPGISGEDVLYAVKTNPWFSQTKVMLVTADPSRVSNETLALADNILPKPIDLAALDTVVKAALGVSV